MELFTVNCGPRTFFCQNVAKLVYVKLKNNVNDFSIYWNKIFLDYKREVLSYKNVDTQPKRLIVQ